MTYLVDTNVLSELRRKHPAPPVLHWFSKRPPAALYLSVLTIGEIRKGVEKLNDAPRKAALHQWLSVDLPEYFWGRILPVDARVCDRWGRMLAAAGRPVPAIDSLLAATAVAHKLVLVTRNVKDFVLLPVATVDPWSGV